MSTKTYGLGYIKDPPHKRTQKDSKLLLGGSPTSPASASLQKFECEILDQGQSGSCTGHGTSQGVYTSFGAAGKPLTFVPSPRSTYDLARVLERAKATTALTDSGAVPSDVMTVLATYGVRPIQAPTPDGRFSDIWTTADTSSAAPNVNTEPNLAELEQAGLKVVTGEYRIEETLATFAEQIKAAISGSSNGGVGCACGIGVFVDTAFMDYDGKTPLNTPPNQKDPNGGGHWLALTYYYTQADGTLVFGGPNSWGSGWGRQGHYEVTEKWLRAAASDIYVFTTGG